MTRETEAHFTNLPKIHLERSKFDMSCSNKLTFNAGDLVPIYVDPDIMAGDTVEMDTAEVVRMATPLFPVMDNAFMEITWFFVPHRLTWDHWPNFWGENDDPWANSTEYEVPMLKAPEGGWTKGTLADYFGLPTYVDNIEVSALPFRAVGKVFNDWWRDENLQYNCHIYTDDTNRTGSNGTSQVLDVELGGMPPKAAKMHDYFTSALPSPQKGPAISIPLGTTAPVRTGNNLVYHVKGDSLSNETEEMLTPLRWTKIQKSTDQSHFITYTNPRESQATFVGSLTGGINGQSPTTHTSGYLYAKDTQDVATQDVFGVPNNLWTDLSSATAATINQLRTAFAIQKFYENAGRNGTRYIEFLRSVFGVESSDARIQRSEYLGGARIPINMDTVLQTSSTDATSPQGNTGAFSCTIASDNMFTKSFEEHGTLLAFVTVRTEHTYQQGIPRGFSRKKWTDFYNPFFANLGEMAILNKEIYATGTTTDDEAFGYQEAWADLRYGRNKICGSMRSNNPTGSLDVWHYADNYSQLPTLSDEWIQEPKTNIDRTLAVQSEIENQFIADFYFKTAYVRPMPIYSIPGLIDHV